MRKIVINTCYGGFSLSDEAELKYKEYTQTTGISIWEIDRDEPYLIQVVEELKEKANGENSKLKIVEIPSYIEYTIEDYDGIEWVAEVHRTWQ